MEYFLGEGTLKVDDRNTKFENAEEDELKRIIDFNLLAVLFHWVGHTFQNYEDQRDLSISLSLSLISIQRCEMNEEIFLSVQLK